MVTGEVSEEQEIPVIVESNYPARKLIDTIRVIQDSEHQSLLIDGEEFPWLIANSGISTQVSRDEIPAITFTLLCKNLEIESSF